MTGPDPIPIAGRGIGAREAERVSAIVEEGRSAGGDTVESFEAAFAEFCAVGEAVATSSGTVALHAALQALGIGEGDRVVTSPLTFATTASAIRLRGAEPVFADVDMETFNLDPHAVRSTVRAHAGDVDAIVAAHLHGLPAAMGELRAIADECGAVLVEDAARAHGARYHGRPVGSLGDVACFSFAPRGDTTAGEGGAVVTDDEAIAARCRQFVDGDGDDRTAHLGRDFGMTNVAAAIGLVRLERLPEFNRRRRSNAARLTEVLEGSSVIPPVEPANRRHVYHRYTVRTQRRSALVAHLADRGIETSSCFPHPADGEPPYGRPEADLPVAERTAEEVLALPVRPDLTDAELDRITSGLTSFGSTPARTPDAVRHD